MTGLRIAFISDAFYPYTIGGAEKRYWEIARRLSKKHEIYFVTLRYWDKGISRGKKSVQGRKKVRVQGFFTTDTLYNKHGKRRLSLVAKFSIGAFIASMSRKFDVIDTPYAPIVHTFSIWLAKKLKKMDTAFIYTVHELWTSYWKKYLGSKLMGTVAEHINRIAVTMLPDAVITVSDYVKRRCINYGVDPSSIYVVPNGIDYEYIESIGNKKQEKGNSDIIFVGRLVPYKGIGLFIKVLELLRRHRKYKAVIIGDGPLREWLHERIAMKGLTDDVTVLPRVSYDTLIQYMKSSKVFILPSFKEGFSIVTIEAMACGLPVVTLNVEGNATIEHILKSNAGILVRPDPKEITEAINRILDNEGERTKMSKRAKQYSKNFDWDNICEMLEKIYIEVKDANIS